jgi:hypothetical protein
MLVLGNEFVQANKERVTSVQAISGTGALRLAAEFVGKFMPGKACYISNPTWGTSNGPRDGTTWHDGCALGAVFELFPSSNFSLKFSLLDDDD